MYLSWDKKIITDFSLSNIESLYNQGYVFTRAGNNILHQTRSLRINLFEFSLSSENRRVLKKTNAMEVSTIPLPYPDYHWSIGKMGKDFYDTKFGPGTFSANKIKDLMTAKEKKRTFNQLFIYRTNSQIIGYCITLETTNIIHYTYPFYTLQTTNQELKNIGMGMMLKTIIWAKEKGKKYIYLGSASRPGDTYKLQFAGLEWWNGKTWDRDNKGLKKILL